MFTSALHHSARLGCALALTGTALTVAWSTAPSASGATVTTTPAARTSTVAAASPRPPRRHGDRLLRQATGHRLLRQATGH